MPSSWIPYDGQNSIPKTAVVGGWEDPTTIYVGRTEMPEGHLVPTKVLKDHSNNKVTAYAAFKNSVHTVTKFDILCGENYFWAPSGNGEILNLAVAGGKIINTGEILFIGRTTFMESMIPGQIRPSHEGLYIPVRNKVLYYRTYDILMQLPETIKYSENKLKSSRRRNCD